MSRAGVQPRVETLDVHCWFWLQFQTRHPWKPRNWPQNYGDNLSLLLAMKIFLESFYFWMKVRSWLKSRTFESALHMLSVNYLNIDGPIFPVKCVKKIQVHSWWRSYVCVRARGICAACNNTEPFSQHTPTNYTTQILNLRYFIWNQFCRTSDSYFLTADFSHYRPFFQASQIWKNLV